jgi:hypothetical protein
MPSPSCSASSSPVLIPPSKPLLQILRALRVFRLLKVIKYVQGFRVILRAISYPFNKLVMVSVIIAIVLYFYTVVSQVMMMMMMMMMMMVLEDHTRLVQGSGGP